MGNAEIQCIIEEMKIKMSRARTVAAMVVMLAASNQESWGGDYIRVKETEKVAKLQTAVISYEKEGKQVDLIGAIHLADRRYYDFLNKHFKGYEVILFEMVGGEKLGGEKKPKVIERLKAEVDSDIADEVNVADDPEKEKNARALRGLREVYQSMEKALGLVGQSAVIDYMAKNFVHADLTLKEFGALQKDRGESLLGFLVSMGMKAERPKNKPNSLLLMGGILAGRADLVKLEMMQTMAEGDKQIDSLAGESVIISDRNIRCMEVMDQQLAAGQEKIGIFYGAAHFTDMRKRMEERGFKKVSTKWLTAWEVNK